MKMLTPEEMCSLLQITKPSLYKLVHLRKIPFQKVGKRLRFPEAKINAWINDKTVDAVERTTEHGGKAKNHKANTETLDTFFC